MNVDTLKIKNGRDTLYNNVSQNLTYTDFIRNDKGELVHKNQQQVLINRPMTDEMLNSYSSKGVR